ncbi:unnamed protein product [Anisakis simplex]|uniref:JmjC domain-containing protein n=1 Tax=Anisakis simplex TaxID=6269 RepID=A0A0M3JZJ8_ANISI|nr:unnamed protein product [Anisakis simplex]
MSINLKDVSGSKISKNNGDCAACGRSTLKSSLIKSSDRSQSCEKLRREQDTFWIQCDHCDCWYHGRCVNVEEYESALIEKYHCERCAITQGPTISYYDSFIDGFEFLVKKALLDHRYAFDDISQQNEPTQIGTKRFIDEFKKTSEQIPIALSEFVQPPKLVADLSWVHKFWPQNKKDSTPVSAMITSRTVFNEHLRAKPEVELFCLVGMKDSYTDFHIDFGGSSVWYHVFKGRKVFYVVAPLERNLQAFSNYQNMANRTEVFFGDLIAPGQLFKVIINEGETLMIPSGWIHAVWTPCDSLVFGGNFLHSLNIEMQLRIYEMETSLETEDRFMFPSFELVNWYAAVSILSKFKEANLHGTIIDGWLLTGTKALLVSLKRWISRDEVKN